MQYRTKLYFALIGIALVSSLSGFGILFFELKKFTLLDEQVKAITVAATTASLLDAELLKQLHGEADQGGAAYQQIKASLLKARTANRRHNIYINYLYTLRPNPQNPQELLFLVDAEENPKLASKIQDVDQNAYVSDVLMHLDEYYCPGKFISDQWGTWLTGFAPIYDEEGNYVATVGADISLDRYLSDLKKLLPIFFYGFAAALLFALGGAYLLARQVTLSLKSLLDCVREIGGGNLECKANLHTHDEFEELGREINTMTEGLQERERLKLNFARYVSHHVMEKILRAESSTKLEGERRKITVLFSDIRQFTHLSEELPPEAVVALLNEYFEVMLEVVFRYQGTLDKFIGDGIMVEFGAPLDDPLQEEHAVAAAIEMQSELIKLVAKWKKEGKPEIAMGVGVHTGYAIVGNIGSERRLEYTAIGDTVNVAARLEQSTKLLKKKILISETTHEAIRDRFAFKSLGPMVLAGRKEPITVYYVDGEGV
ncbi:MAG: HAMP domain-containing protein [Verrucomicrobia bacterium]|nr:HAMP domain-containing protein [Verrucomicrobiota bacterium]